MLHIAGTRIAGDLAGRLEKAGFHYRRCVLYEARTADGLSDKALALLKAGAIDGVLLYSPRTAATFSLLVEKAGLYDALLTMTAFCLSSAVAGKIGEIAWKDIIVADAPDEVSLVEKVLELAGKA